MTPPVPPVQPVTAVPAVAPFYYSIQQFCPPWLQDEDSIKFFFTAGSQVDCSAEYVRLGMLQRFPTSTDRAGNLVARPEAVAAQGRDRGISRGQYEPDGSYRDRVKTARKTWSRAGNAQTLLRQLRAYYLPDPPVIRYVVNGRTAAGDRFADWMTMFPDGSIERHRSLPNNWDWDGSPGQVPLSGDPDEGPKYVRFWVIIYAGGFTPWFWGPFNPPLPGFPLNWGGGQSWGFVEQSTWLRDVRQIIGQWKAAGSHAGIISQGYDGGIIAAFDPLLFDPLYPPGGVLGYPMPDGNWNNPDNRPNTAVFLSGI